MEHKWSCAREIRHCKLFLLEMIHSGYHDVLPRLHQLPLVVKLLIAAKNWRVYWTMHISGHSFRYASTVVHTLYSGFGCGIAIFYEVKIVCHWLIIWNLHPSKTACIQIQIMLGYGLRKQRMVSISKTARRSWRQCAGCFHKDDRWPEVKGRREEKEPNSRVKIEDGKHGEPNRWSLLLQKGRIRPIWTIFIPRTPTRRSHGAVANVIESLSAYTTGVKPRIREQKTIMKNLGEKQRYINLTNKQSPNVPFYLVI